MIVLQLVVSVRSSRDLDEAQARRLAGLLETWLGKGSMSPGSFLRPCVEQLPAEDAARLVGAYFARVPGVDGTARAAAAVNRPGDVALLHAALTNIVV